MNKESSYQRLKRENAELKNKLYKLAVHPDSEESILIRTEIVIQSGIERAMFYGESYSGYLTTGIKNKVS